MPSKVAVSVRLNAHQLEETRKLARLLDIRVTSAMHELSIKRH